MTGPLLYAENDENDVFLFHRALKRVGFAYRFESCRNGREAVAYLRGDGPLGDRQRYPLPSLLVLDLKMPEMNGMEVLKWARTDGGFGTLPIMLFSSSTQPSDIDEAVKWGANAYAIKPGTPQQLESMMKKIRDEVFAVRQERSIWAVDFNQCAARSNARVAR